MSKGTYQTGIAGETQAKEYLESLGMVFVRSRYKCAFGEIDLIMLDGNLIVFVEVKTRFSGNAGTGLTAIDRRKQFRIARAAVCFLQEIRRPRSAVRFDAVEINREGIIYIRDAFQPGLPV